MQTTSERIPRLFARLLLVSSILTCGAAAQTDKTLLTDAQAQALILRMQTKPGVPLSQAESQQLSKYLVARNAQLTAAAGSQVPQATAATIQTAVAAPALATAATPVGTAGAKKPGVVRIGVVQSKTDLGQGQAPSAGEPVRTLIEQYLTGPKLESIPLAALLPQQAEAEAKEKGCDYLLFSSLTQTKPTGAFGMLKGGSSMLNMIPMVGMASSASSVIALATVASAASASASLAGQVKAKNDVTFEYSLLVPGTPTPVLANKTTAHAKTDGENLITPMIEAAATAVVNKTNPVQ